MTRAQMEAARERVGRVLSDHHPDRIVDTDLCGRLVCAALGHPDGKVPKVARERMHVRRMRAR